MIGQRELALMPRDAFLITTARGGIVEEGALAAALETKQIAGAGVDVWNVEPPPLEHPLLTFDNVIATYHTAGVTVDSRHLMAQWNAEQLVHIFQGKRPPRLVNPEAWEGFAQRLRRRSDSDRSLNCVPVQGARCCTIPCRKSSPPCATSNSRRRCCLRPTLWRVSMPLMC